jgi:hypothetical protein
MTTQNSVFSLPFGAKEFLTLALISIFASCGKASGPTFAGSSKLYSPKPDELRSQSEDGKKEEQGEDGTDVPNMETDNPPTDENKVAVPPGLPPNARAASTVSVVKTQREVDVLWVVDTSGSMGQEQAALAAGFQEFVSGLQSLNIRFQTALTTTDVCESENNGAQKITPECPVASGGNTSTRLRGSFVGDVNRTVLKGEDADILEKFSLYAGSVGTQGSGFEHGLSAATHAVKKSVTGVNEPLVRRDAFLSIIVVSDEEDDGIGLGLFDRAANINYVAEGLTYWRYDHRDFTRDLDAIKGSGNYSVNAITGTRDAQGALCSSAFGTPIEEGTQYIAAAKATGGNVESICSSNWNALLTQIATNLKTQISQIRLMDEGVVEKTIEIFVDGQRLSRKFWTYRPTQNTVSFSSLYTPPLGSKIEIKYYAAPN